MTAPDAVTRDGTAPGTAAVRAQREITATPRGRIATLLLGLAVGAAFGAGDDVARLAVGLLAGPLAFDWFCKWAPGTSVLIRPLPRRGRSFRTGAPARDVVEVSAAGGTWHPPAVLRDVTLGEPRHAVGMPALSRRPQQIELPVRPLRRGIVRERRFTVTSRWPLGLFVLHRMLVLELDPGQVVEPSRRKIPAAMRAVLEGAGRAARGAGAHDAHAARTPADDGEFHALREARAGDDVRRLHALRSAAFGFPVVRVERRGGAAEDLVVVLDLGLPPTQRSATREQALQLEHDLGLVAALADHALRHGMHLEVQVLAAGGTADERRHHLVGPRRGPRSAVRGVHALMRTLAEARFVAGQSAAGQTTVAPPTDSRAANDDRPRIVLRPGRSRSPLLEHGLRTTRSADRAQERRA